MALLRRDQAKSKNETVTSYSPIAQSLSTELNPAGPMSTDSIGGKHTLLHLLTITHVAVLCIL